MIANLKAKAEGLDKKRVYTAVVALMIAGAAGHFMQRSAESSTGQRPLTASVPGTSEVRAPAPQVAAATSMPAITPAVSAQKTPEPEPEPALAEAVPGQPIPPAPEMPQAAPVEQASREEMPPRTAPQAEDKPAVPGTTIAEGRDTDEPELEVARANTPATQPEDPPFEAVEVTRSASEPILALPTAMADTAVPEAETPDIVVAGVDSATDPTLEPAPPIANCDLAFDVVAQPGAMVALTFAAPCNAGENVEFTHVGLKFSEQLGPDGDLFLEVPAMAAAATFRAVMEAGQEAGAETMVPDFAAFERVALVWKGPTGLQLHALESGASYGAPGHIWAESPGKPETERDGLGGFVSVLGSTAGGYAADIYTYPAKLMADGTEPVVSVEAQVMENTCGTEIEGEILRTNPTGLPAAQPLAMIVPGCEAVGEYLVLNNLPQDLKLARN